MLRRVMSKSFGLELNWKTYEKQSRPFTEKCSNGDEQRPKNRWLYCVLMVNIVYSDVFCPPPKREPGKKSAVSRTRSTPCAASASRAWTTTSSTRPRAESGTCAAVTVPFCFLKYCQVRRRNCEMNFSAKFTEHQPHFFGDISL